MCPPGNQGDHIEPRVREDDDTEPEVEEEEWEPIASDEMRRVRMLVTETMQEIFYELRFKCIRLGLLNFWAFKVYNSWLPAYQYDRDFFNLHVFHHILFYQYCLVRWEINPHVYHELDVSQLSSLFMLLAYAS